MATKKGNGLLMVYSDVAAEDAEEYNRWYNDCLLYTSPSPRDRG